MFKRFLLCFCSTLFFSSSFAASNPCVQFLGFQATHSHSSLNVLGIEEGEPPVLNVTVPLGTRATLDPQRGFDRYFGRRINVIYHDTTGYSQPALLAAGNTVMTGVLTWEAFARQAPDLAFVGQSIIDRTPLAQRTATSESFKEQMRIVFDTGRQIHSSPLFSSSKFNQVDEEDILQRFNALLLPLLHEGHTHFANVSLIHSHPGTASPPSITDKAMVVSLMVWFRQNGIRVDSMHNYVVHPANPNLVFDYEVTEADLMACRLRVN